MAKKEKQPRKRPVAFADDPDRQELYLFHLAGGTNEVWPGWSGAAQLAGVSYSTVVAHRKRDPEFSDREQAAYELYRDRLRREIDRRGRRGVLKGVYHQGARCGHERQYSDRLLLAQAKAHLPEFKEKSELDVNVSGSMDLGELSKESRALLREILRKEAKRRKEAEQ